MYDTILVEARDDVCVITLNRPEKLNAWTYQMGAELAEAVVVANETPEVSAIVITGAGRGFCAGADIEDVFAKKDRGDQKMRDWVALVRASKPIVAAINGPAIGAGLTQVLPCDGLYAAQGAKLSLRFIQMGLVPELASSALLPQRVGFGAASDLMLTGRTILAEEALAMRLVDRVFPADRLLPEAIAFAQMMGRNSPSALRVVKSLLTENASENDLKLVQKREMDALNRAYESPEHAEAIAAFLEKRPPDFKKRG